MTEKDKKLIARARKLSYTQHYEIDRLQDEAESEEAKRILRQIEITLYHQEEFHAGCL